MKMNQENGPVSFPNNLSIGSLQNEATGDISLFMDLRVSDT